MPGLTGGGAATSPALDGSPNEAALPSFGSGFPQPEPGITSPFDSGLTLDTYSQNGYWETVNYTYAVVEEYVYDAGGRLDEVKSAQGYFDSIDYAEIKSHGHQVNAQDFVYGPGATVKRGEFVYDKMGRVTNQYDFAANGTTKVFDRAVLYNTDGTVQRETTVTTKGSDSYRSVANNYYNADNTLNYVLTTNTKNGSNSGAPNTRTDNTYVYFDGAVQSQVLYDENTGSSSNTVFRSTYTYDGVGTLQSAQINDGRPRTVSYINNAEGQVISRKEKDNNHTQGDPSEIYYRFGGKEIGRVGNNGTSNVNYERTIAERTANTSSATGAFRNNAATGVGYADFGGDYDAINSYAQGSGGGSYTVRGGENLQAIAAQLWGDSALWYKIAEANGLRGSETLIEGQRLTIPTGVTRVHNNSGTIKPYDPAEAIGDTSPTTAAQPKKKKCGVFGAILLAVVAIAVAAVVTGGALALAAGKSLSAGLATIGIGSGTAIGGATAGGIAAASAVGGAVGSIASQGVGIATGIQDKFSFKGVALAAIAGGISGGLGASGVFGKVTGGSFKAGAIGIKSGILDAAVRGAVSGALTQGAATATGLQSKFNFAGVAAAGVGAAAGNFTGGRFGKPANGFAAFGQNLAANSAGAIANAATRSAWTGQSFGDSVISAIPDAIGAAIGNVVVGAVAIAAKVDSNPSKEPAQSRYYINDPAHDFGGLRRINYHGADGAYGPTIVVTGTRIKEDDGFFDQLGDALVDNPVTNYLTDNFDFNLEIRAPSDGFAVDLNIRAPNFALNAQFATSASSNHRNGQAGLSVALGERGFAVVGRGSSGPSGTRFQGGLTARDADGSFVVGGALRTNANSVAVSAQGNAFGEDFRVVGAIASANNGGSDAVSIRALAERGDLTSAVTGTILTSSSGISGQADIIGTVPVIGNREIGFSARGSAALKASGIGGSGNASALVKHPDGSVRTLDGKFASISGAPAPGSRAPANFAGFLKSNGVQVVGRELEFNGPLGVRRYDIVTRNPDGSLHGLEIKTGSARPNPYQRFTDLHVNRFGAEGRGRAAGERVTGASTVYLTEDWN
ncbi:LysM peptidoglycan-binding domain-containing protein [Qipengyuania sp. DGS5-3]|uniref:LysM peptidoglycan-binding domain-containing protein n=1 Tax=Qipengyuania sp. DGS5-3 TaxID=3349632 RepID=UPI0036D28571